MRRTSDLGRCRIFLSARSQETAGWFVLLLAWLSNEAARTRVAPPNSLAELIKNGTEGLIMFNKSRIRLVLGGMLAAAIASAPSTALAASSATATGTGNVAGWVKSATLLGTAPGSQSVTIAVHMALQNTAGLKSLVAEVSSPNNKQYGRYLTPEEFDKRFAPATTQVNGVKAMLEKAGMSDVQVGPYGVYVSARATVSQLRTAFHVTQNLYSYKGLTLRANKEEPTIPAALSGKVLYIDGLDDTGQLRQPFHHSVVTGALVAPAATSKSAAASASTVTPPPVAAGNPSPYCNTIYGAKALVATLSTAADVYGAAIPWLGCGYTPQQIRAAYGINKVKYTGSGITVAIIDAFASPTLLADSNRYAANHALPTLKLGVNFSQIIPLGAYNVAAADVTAAYGWWGEESLDMAAVHGAAPGANIVYVGSTDAGPSLDIAFVNTVYNHLADVVTDSWGNNGESIAAGEQATFDQAAMAGAAEGTTILFSSGDNGDLSAANGVASGAWPATSAYVTGVGGTTLEIMDSSGTKAEYGWGTYRAFLNDVTVKSAKSVMTSGVATTVVNGTTYDDFSFYSGSGGGISLLESQPSYQAAAVPAMLANSLNLASGYTETLPTAQRVSPDVAMVADPYTGYLYGETFTIAGNAIADSGCKAISKTQEYCETAIGGTSLASPLMAGVIAIMNQKRASSGEPLVGFANPLFYSAGSRSNGTTFNQALNQIIAPTENVSLLRGYAANLNEARVVTINSVPSLAVTSPFSITVCGVPMCLGVDEVFNYTSLANDVGWETTTAGYNDVTGLGVPYLPKLINEE
jgi:subtilase family serine protease